MLVGPVEAGKSTLFKAIFDREGETLKTQAVEFDEGGIDTPGEYCSHPRLYSALINTASDVDILVYVHPCNDTEFRMPPGLLSVYGGKRIVAVLTKTDLPGTDPDGIEDMLRKHGFSGPFFRTSDKDPRSVERLKTYLLGESPATDDSVRS